MSDVALQFNARTSASLTLIHESCPAGFEIAQGIIPGQYVCQCSKIDLNIQSCNENTEDVLLKVRVLCVHVALWCPSSVLQYVSLSPILLKLPIFPLYLNTSHTSPPPPSSHAGLAVGHSHHQCKWYQGPVHHRLFPWLLPLPAVVHRQWGRVQVHCVSGLGPEGPAVYL